MEDKKTIFKNSCVSCSAFGITPVVLSMVKQNSNADRSECIQNMLNELIAQRDTVPHFIRQFAERSKGSNNDVYTGFAALLALTTSTQMMNAAVVTYLTTYLYALAKEGMQVTYTCNFGNEYAIPNARTAVTNLVPQTVDSLLKLAKETFTASSGVVDSEASAELSSEERMRRKAFAETIRCNKWAEIPEEDIPRLSSGQAMSIKELDDTLNASLASTTTDNPLYRATYRSDMSNDITIESFLAKVLPLLFAPDDCHFKNAFIAVALFYAERNYVIRISNTLESKDSLCDLLRSRDFPNWTRLKLFTERYFRIDSVYDTDTLVELLTNLYSLGGMRNVVDNVVDAIKNSSKAALQENPVDALIIALNTK